MVDASASTTPSWPRPTTLLEAAVQILLTADPHVKAAMTSRVAADWRSGRLATAYHEEGDDPSPPDKPARDGRVKTVPSGKTARIGKGGTLASRQAIIHSLTHIESWAVDLSWVSPAPILVESERLGGRCTLKTLPPPPCAGHHRSLRGQASDAEAILRRFCHGGGRGAL